MSKTLGTAMETASTSDELRSCCVERNDPGARFLEVAKLAVAVAVIKSKPTGRSGKQQAKYLASRLRQEDNNWKAKVQELQEQVLRLRQQLLLAKAQPKDIRGCGTDSMELISQAAEVSSESNIPWEGDSGFGRENNFEGLSSSSSSAVPDTEHTLLKPVPFCGMFPLAPCCGPNASAREKAMLHHTRFLQSLVGQGQLACAGDGSVAMDSLCCLLSCMTEACADTRLLPPAPLLLRSARVVSCAMGSLRGVGSGQLMRRAEAYLKELVDLLLGNTCCNWFQAQELLADCLIILGGCAPLKPTFIHHALCELNTFGDHLWQTMTEGLGSFDVARYENCFYLLWVLEQLLEDGCGTRGCWESSMLGPTLNLLEANVLRLSDEFPLLAIFMWRVAGCLKAAHV